MPIPTFINVDIVIVKIYNLMHIRIGPITKLEICLIDILFSMYRGIKIKTTIGSIKEITFLLHF